MTKRDCVISELPVSPGPVFRLCGDMVCLEPEKFEVFYLYLTDLITFAKDAKAKCGKEKKE